MKHLPLFVLVLSSLTLSAQAQCYGTGMGSPEAELGKRDIVGAAMCGHIEFRVNGSGSVDLWSQGQEKSVFRVANPSTLGNELIAGGIGAQTADYDAGYVVEAAINAEGDALPGKFELVQYLRYNGPVVRDARPEWQCSAEANALLGSFVSQARRSK